MVTRKPTADSILYDAVDEALLQEIDEVISSKRPSPSRHHWIVSAIVEKLDREKSKSGQNDI